MNKYLQRRIDRAKNIPAENVTIADVTPLDEGKVLISGTVKSSTNGQYNTVIRFDIVSERLVEASCTCEDFGETQLPAIPDVRPVVSFCKHIGSMVLSFRNGGAKLALPGDVLGLPNIEEQAERSRAIRMAGMGLEYG